MKELLKAYVNNCWQVPKDQLEMLPEDLLYSYFRRILNSDEMFHNYEISLFDKFIKKADEHTQYKLLLKKIKFHRFVKLYETVIKKYFNFILNKSNKDNSEHSRILAFLTIAKEYNFSDDFIVDLQLEHLNNDIFLPYYLEVLLEKNLIPSIRLKYHTLFTEYSTTKMILDKYNINISPHVEVDEKLKIELLKNYPNAITIGLYIGLIFDFNVMEDKIIAMLEKGCVHGGFNYEFNSFLTALSRFYDPIPDEYYLIICLYDCKHNVIDLLYVYETYSEIEKGTIKTRLDVLEKVAKEKPENIVNSNYLMRNHKSFEDKRLKEIISMAIQNAKAN